MKLIFGILFCIMNTGFGQVCCSLSGGVDPGLGEGISAMNIHWPSPFAVKNEQRLLVGILGQKQGNGNSPIHYGLNGGFFIQYSKAGGYNQVFFVHTSLSRSSIREKISFEEWFTDILSLELNMGYRYLLPKKLGWFQLRYDLAEWRNYSTKQFPFKTPTVGSLNLSWLYFYRFSHQFMKYLLPGGLSTTLTAKKNTGQVQDVIVDEIIAASMATSYAVKKLFVLSVLTQLEARHLETPNTFADVASGDRWISAVYLGINALVKPSGLPDMTFQVRIPVFTHSSFAGIPPGSEPRLNLSIGFSHQLRLSH